MSHHDIETNQEIVCRRNERGVCEIILDDSNETTGFATQHHAKSRKTDNHTSNKSKNFADGAETNAAATRELVGRGILADLPITGNQFDTIGAQIRSAFVSGRGNEISKALGDFDSNPKSSAKVQEELSHFLRSYAQMGGIQTAISVADGRVTLFREFREIEQKLYSRPYDSSQESAINKPFDNADYRKSLLQALGLEKNSELYKRLNDPSRLELYTALRDKNGIELQSAISRFKDSEGMDKGKVDYSKLEAPLNDVLDLFEMSDGRSPFIIASDKGTLQQSSQMTVYWNKYPSAVPLNTFAIKQETTQNDL